MKCKICSSTTEYYFNQKVLYKYDVAYYKCPSCGFVQTEDPYWLGESYNSAITSLDIGMVMRNIACADETAKLISNNLNLNKRFVDYGGGYGLFVRMLRDKGFDFYRFDTYCENLFAYYFDISNIDYSKEKFELLTSFEVFEHLENPIEETEKMLGLSDTIFFSTLLHNGNIPMNWWYLGVTHGQHLALYTYDSLEKLAKLFDCYFYSNGVDKHIISKLEFNHNPLLPIPLPNYNVSISDKIKNKIIKFLQPKPKPISKPPEIRESLLQKDYEFLLEKYKKQ